MAITAFSLFIVPIASGANEAVRIVDGDTIEINGTTYRLHGIDAPEAGQKCHKTGGGEWACGKASVSALEDLALGQRVTCDNRGRDDYDRIIAVCRTGNGIDLNAKMVSSGNAWAFRRFSEDYVTVEEEARSRRVGVFQAETQTPWEYRAERWDVADVDFHPEVTRVFHRELTHL
ncbi:thermonuclease family protein [Tropicibacter oceani]|uniref:Thermonuclease family protein n=1 Tax=Tropicibacter oceani TaxID=3058420 RepID=A0ABY8QKP0_9RHOB|nr:thermonuclease family protein [Tropicibacter oceani]WGW05080.1 thermonuclease family protein [Tropicibacter oceani]